MRKDIFSYLNLNPANERLIKMSFPFSNVIDINNNVNNNNDNNNDNNDYINVTFVDLRLCPRVIDIRR